jgi:glycine cleavage system H protein
VNERLADGPEKLNADPHGEAWLVKLRVTNPDEIKNLLTAADYQQYIGD